MLQKYLFIRDIGHLSSDTVIFRLYVGTSRRERGALKELAQVCHFTDSCLILYGEEVAETLWKIAEKVFPNAQCPILHFRGQEIKPSKLLRLLRKNELIAYEGTIQPSRQYFQSLSIFENDIYAKNLLKKSSRPCTEPSRKYLSESDSVSFQKACIGFAMIAIVFLVAGFIEGHFGFYM